jgi:ATP-binding cassette subfamily B multidrug efflux pump
MLAAGLEVLGPLLGKFLIDDHLLPASRRLDPHGRPAAGRRAADRLGRLLAALPAAGAPVRPGDALGAAPARWVYGHVLRLPMAFFDRAITGQLVSRVTNDTEAVKTCTSRCCS